MKKTDELQIPEIVQEVRKNRVKALKRRLKTYWPIYVMMIPVVVFYLVFSYYPMYGIIVSFIDYMPAVGINGSPWAADDVTGQLDLFKHFRTIFNAYEFSRSIGNTLILSFLKIIFMFPMPIIMALALNEVKSTGYKKTIQTIVYLPNFISWVIFGNIVKDIFGGGGLIDNLGILFTGDPKYSSGIMQEPSKYYPIVIFMSILKDTGWNTIIYMAAISAVSPTLYEAGTIDGCGRFRLMWNVTIPCIGPVVVLQFLLAIGNIMNAGFDAVFNTYNDTLYETADILDTYVYRLGITSGNYEQAGAVGIFKSIINFILLMGANFLVKKINGTGIYDLND